MHTLCMYSSCHPTTCISALRTTTLAFKPVYVVSLHCALVYVRNTHKYLTIIIECIICVCLCVCVYVCVCVCACVCECVCVCVCV